MRIIFALNHPAHYHLFKNTADELADKGHYVVFVYKDKDILEKLLNNSNIESVEISAKNSNSGSKFSIIRNRTSELFKQDLNLFNFSRKFKPDLLLGTDISITHIGIAINIPSIVFNEDDFQINKLFCYSAYPFARHIVTPLICNVGRFSKKKIGYNGYQKLAYLHPNRFIPVFSKVKQYISVDKPYFIIRLVSFTAGHDIEQKHSGLSELLIKKLIDKLSDKGYVYISSEIPVRKEFQKYLLNIDPADIHHFIYYAGMFIADSQSMIVESAMLGTPSIRFNSFVGQISVLEELENKYLLTSGIHNSQPDQLLKKTDEFLAINNLKEIFRQRRQTMLSQKIDLTSFMVWLIESYPESAEIMKSNTAFQDRFK